MKKSIAFLSVSMFTCMLFLAHTPLVAQNLRQAPAFKSGEELRCNFYFNWKFIWVKAGGASLTIRDTLFHGKRVQYMRLLSTTNSKADAFFRMRDTLTTIFTPDLKPLYYRKASAEGKRYSVSEVWYDYLANGKTKVSQYYRRDKKSPRYIEEVYDKSIYDMMSLLAYARTLDFASLKENQRLTFSVATGKRVEPQHLIYRGRKVLKADDGHKYNCLVISLVEEDDGKEKELVNFFVTDDANHMPILLDLQLNFGSAKARLTEKKGILYPLKPIE